MQEIGCRVVERAEQSNAEPGIARVFPCQIGECDQGPSISQLAQRERELKQNTWIGILLQGQQGVHDRLRDRKRFGDPQRVFTHRGMCVLEGSDHNRRIERGETFERPQSMQPRLRIITLLHNFFQQRHSRLVLPLD